MEHPLRLNVGYLQGGRPMQSSFEAAQKLLWSSRTTSKNLDATPPQSHHVKPQAAQNLLAHHVTGIANRGEREALVVLDHVPRHLPGLAEPGPPRLEGAQAQACHPAPGAHHGEDAVHVTGEDEDAEGACSSNREGRVKAFWCVTATARDFFRDLL